jgi:hypothetical protein
MDVVDAIAWVQTKAGDVPINPVVLKNVRLKPTEKKPVEAPITE